MADSTNASPADLGVYGPYERAAIAAIALADKVIDSQPPDIKAKIWELLIAHLQRDQEFWTGVMNRIHPPAA